MWYRQTINNACALYGILHAISNVEDGGAGYGLHRLVHLATRKWLEMQGTKRKWEEQALLLVADMFPGGHFETWATCESFSYLTHKQ